MTDYEVLFDTSPSGVLDAGWQSGTVRQRTKTVKAGEFVYVESYPIWDTAHRRAADEAKAKRKKTSAAQERINRRRARLHIEQIINANFGQGDLLITCTYPDSAQPADADRAHRDIQNYMARLKRLREKKGLPALKYVYTTEYTESEKRGLRFHHHAIINGGLTRDEAEALWSDKHAGGICNSRIAQVQDEGLSGWASYITKQLHPGAARDEGAQKRATVRGWCRSRNLKIPKETVADKKISRRKVEKIARDVEVEGRQIFEKLYPGYHVVGEVQVFTSTIVPGAYIRVRLRREAGK